MCDVTHQKRTCTAKSQMMTAFLESSHHISNMSLLREDEKNDRKQTLREKQQCNHNHHLQFVSNTAPYSAPMQHAHHA